MKFSKMLRLGVIAASVFPTGNAHATPEQDFWKWFQSNESSLFDFEKDQERTFARLNTEMSKLNPNLTFEFGPKKDGRREFTISADGIRDAFPEVEKLYATAPVLARWKILRFRQRHTPSDISMGDVSVKANSVAVKVQPNGQLVDLTVFVPGYAESARKSYSGIVYLLLDEALGEFDVETRVGQITIKSTSEVNGQTCTLAALPKEVDALFAKR
jgi:hypothetical protein